MRALFSGAAVMMLLPLLGGCPTESVTNVVAGPASTRSTVGNEASVEVIGPRSDLTIPGGTLVEVVYQVTATTPSGTVEIWFDPDQDAFNQNQVAAAVEQPLSQTSTLINTANLEAGTYFVGVGVRERGQLAAFAYAPGRVTVNAQPRLVFSSPRGNFTFDRSNLINRNFTIAWGPAPGRESIDEDFEPGRFRVDIFLDGDPDVSGDEVLLFTTTSRQAESFDFAFRSSIFEPGTYRFLAVVTDGQGRVEVRAPGSIRLRNRLAGMYDLRDLDDPTGGELSGAIFEGFHPGDNAGSFVDGLNDVDGDGFGDMMFLAQFGKPFFDVDQQRNGSGEGYLVYGRPERFSGRMNLNSTGTLFRGELFVGIEQVSDPIRPSRGIRDFAMMDDWDGDGLRELAFGVPFIDSAPVRSQLSGIGTILDPIGYFRSGGVVVAAGNILRPDAGFPGQQIIQLASIGAISHVPLECDACFGEDACCPQGFYGTKAFPIFCGNTYFNGHWSSVEGDPPFAGGLRLGARFSTNGFGDQFGDRVDAWAFRSIVMSAPNRNPSVINQLDTEGAGLISVYFVEDGWIPWVNVGNPQPAPAFGYPGPSANGTNVLPYGGPYFYIVDDFQLTDIGGPISGTSLVPGSPGYARQLGDWPDNCEEGFSFDGNAPWAQTTLRFWSATQGAQLNNATAVQDLNADGLQDLAIGAPFAEDGRGSTFVFFGRLKRLMQTNSLQIEEYALPQQGPDPLGQRIFDGIRVLGGPGERLGQEQDTAGDFNNDGVTDIAIGSPLLRGRRVAGNLPFAEQDPGTPTPATRGRTSRSTRWVIPPRIWA